MTTILPRSAWTTTPDNRHQKLDPARVVGLAVHYPAAGNAPLGGLTKAQVARRLEGWRKYHVNSHGWRDIGYNYAIDQSGRIWFLTGLDVGAHANAVGNTTRVGVLFVIGDNEKPTDAALAAFRDLRSWILARMPKATRVEGHQQIPGNSTSCPGKPLMAAIRAGQLSGNSNQTPLEDDMELSDQIKLTPAIKKELGTTRDTQSVGGALQYGAAAYRVAQRTEAQVRALIKSQGKGEVTAAAIAAELAPALLDGLGDVVREVLAEFPTRDADQIAVAVVAQMAARLAEVAE